MAHLVRIESYGHMSPPLTDTIRKLCQAQIEYLCKAPRGARTEQSILQTGWSKRAIGVADIIVLAVGPGRALARSLRGIALVQLQGDGIYLDLLCGSGYGKLLFDYVFSGMCSLYWYYRFFACGTRAVFLDLSKLTCDVRFCFVVFLSGSLYVTYWFQFRCCL